MLRVDLDLDAFDAPMTARIYIDYKNIADRPIAGVKFRIRFSDDSGKDRGTFHAADAAVLVPGEARSQKWKHERIDPRSTVLKVRVLKVKFADGSEWLSNKVSEITAPRNLPADAGGSETVPANPSDNDLKPSQ